MLWLAAIHQKGCHHQNRTPPDWAPERWVICCDCGHVMHTRFTGAIFERLMDRINERGADRQPTA